MKRSGGNVEVCRFWQWGEVLVLYRGGYPARLPPRSILAEPEPASGGTKVI